MNFFFFVAINNFDGWRRKGVASFLVRPATSFSAIIIRIVFLKRKKKGGGGGLCIVSLRDGNDTGIL